VAIEEYELPKYRLKLFIRNTRKAKQTDKAKKLKISIRRITGDNCRQ
jgi:hypothetical protein